MTTPETGIEKILYFLPIKQNFLHKINRETSGEFLDYINLSKIVPRSNYRGKEYDSFKVTQFTVFR